MDNIINSTPQVSICMPTCNRAESLKDTIPTILNQTFKDFELIINDDASTDDTEEVVMSFNDPRIRYYCNSKNLNMPGNLNRAIINAKGKYIAVFHDHDLYEPSVIEEMVSLLNKESNIGFVHTGIFWLNVDTRAKRDLTASWAERTPGKEMLKKLLWSWSCPICALTMVRKRCYDEVGLYDPAYGFISDVDMWMRLCMKYDVGYIAKPLITCLEREKNHKYAGFNWEILHMNVLMHQENIERYYGKKMIEYYGSRIWFSLKKDLFYMKNLAIALYKKDHDNVQKGLALMKIHCLPFTKILMGPISILSRRISIAP